MGHHLWILGPHCQPLRRPPREYTQHREATRYPQSTVASWTFPYTWCKETVKSRFNPDRHPGLCTLRCPSLADTFCTSKHVVRLLLCNHVEVADGAASVFRVPDIRKLRITTTPAFRIVDNSSRTA